jgi:hypothetical protein
MPEWNQSPGGSPPSLDDVLEKIRLGLKGVSRQTLWDKFGILLTDTLPENCRFNQFIT